jgi:hypothetical protein
VATQASLIAVTFPLPLPLEAGLRELDHHTQSQQIAKKMNSHYFPKIANAISLALVYLGTSVTALVLLRAVLATMLAGLVLWFGHHVFVPLEKWLAKKLPGLATSWWSKSYDTMSL